MGLLSPAAYAQDASTAKQTAVRTAVEQLKSTLYFALRNKAATAELEEDAELENLEAVVDTGSSSDSGHGCNANRPAPRRGFDGPAGMARGMLRGCGLRILSRQGGFEVTARVDPQLAEDVVQVPLNRARA